MKQPAYLVITLLMLWWLTGCGQTTSASSVWLPTPEAKSIIALVGNAIQRELEKLGWRWLAGPPMGSK